MSVPQRPPGPPVGRPPFRPPQNGTANGGLPHQAPVTMPGFPGYMAPPPVMPNFPPPLPPGWSEHTAPDGRTKYYYNSETKQSTYTRPSFAPLPPTATPGGPSAASGSSSASVVKKKEKKEKPKDRVPIPGTTWTRVTTTEGNVFYFEKESKRSEWTIPDEIKDAVEALETEEKAKKEEEARLVKEKEEQERLERLREQERVRAEVEEERKRKAAAAAAAAERKRKEREEQSTVEEEPPSKVPKATGPQGDAAENGDEAEYAPVDEEDEEAWQRAVAAEFAEADALAKANAEKEKEEAELAEEEAAKKVFAVPEKVTVSLEEGRALFKALLYEKDISPFAPWDQSLPLFINDPRYVLLSSIKDRREVFEEYCRDVGRARRLNKGSSAVKHEEKKVDPEREYKALMREEVTSTRTRWDDFRKKWKKDRRFYNYGRDDRDREKLFKTHLRELGERKRADAQRAEQDFFDLLKENDNITSSSVWSDVKRSMSHDPRYDAVGSSSLREEFFNTYLKNLSSSSTSTHETPEQAAERKLAERKAKQEASLREREARVREEQSRVVEETNKSRLGAGKEEAERLFGSLLVDQVRDAETTWEAAVPFLSQDPRFSHPALRPFDKQRLFSEHLGRLGAKRSNALHTLFQQHAPALDTPFDSVYDKLIEDPVVKRLNLDPQGLEDRWNAWKRARESEARVEFDTMLGENSFVEFWGRMRKKRVDEEAEKIKDEEMMPDEEDDSGLKSVRELAQQIDLDEIKAVLRRDKRYRQFDHIPEVREQWLRDYLANLEAASGSQTVHNVGLGRVPH